MDFDSRQSTAIQDLAHTRAGPGPGEGGRLTRASRVLVNVESPSAVLRLRLEWGAEGVDWSWDRVDGFWEEGEDRDAGREELHGYGVVGDVRCFLGGLGWRLGEYDERVTSSCLIETGA